MRTWSKVRHNMKRLVVSKTGKNIQQRHRLRTVGSINHLWGLKQFYCRQIFTLGPGIILNTKPHKKLGLPNDLHDFCMHHSENEKKKKKKKTTTTTNKKQTNQMKKKRKRKKQTNKTNKQTDIKLISKKKKKKKKKILGKSTNDVNQS